MAQVRQLLASALATLALGVAGCGNDANEQPRVDQEPRVQTVLPTPTPDSPTPTPEPTADPNPLAGLRPCSLVSRGNARALGLKGPRAKRVGEARVCRWRYEGATLADSYTVSIALFEVRSVEDVVGRRIRPVPRIGAHRAVTFVAPASSCVVAIATGRSSRVDAAAVGGERPQACRLAMQLAQTVEKRLP